MLKLFKKGFFFFLVTQHGYTAIVLMWTIIDILTLLTQQIPVDWTWLGTYICTSKPVTVTHTSETMWNNVFVFFPATNAFSTKHWKLVCRNAAVLQPSYVVQPKNRSAEPSQQASVPEQRASSHLHLSTAPFITQMKQAQTICSYKIRNCIWQFLNKCIQVQLKAFQFCQVLVE